MLHFQMHVMSDLNSALAELDTENTAIMSGSYENITTRHIRLHIYIITTQSLGFDNHTKP